MKPSALRTLLLSLASTSMAAGIALSPGCGDDGGNDCADGLDNDGDGLVDSADPGCALNGDLETPDPVFPACGDGEDNDEDGLIDLQDPGCDSSDDDDETNEDVAACKDGIDNDGDGLIDFPNDPGCKLSLEDSEADSCPDGEDCPACSNGIDDDGDGTADYPDDLGCNDAGDDDEFSPSVSPCGGTVPLSDLPSNGMVTGSLGADKPNDLISQGCGGTGSEVAYEFDLDAPAALEIRTNFPETTVDTVVYLQSSCGQIDAELGCNDDSGTDKGSRLFIPRVEAGSYFIIVDTHPGQSGDFSLQLTTTIPEGESCDDQAPNCAANLECLGGAGNTTCQVPPTGPTCDDSGTVRQKNVPQAGDLVISEYMANPDEVADAAGEWFEIQVNANVDIGGLQIGRASEANGLEAVSLTLDPTQCLPVSAGAHLLFARNDNSVQNGGLPSVDQLMGISIVNSNRGLYIGMDDQTLDTVTYSSTTAGASTQRDPVSGDFCTSTQSYGAGDLGTPGAANESCP